MLSPHPNASVSVSHCQTPYPRWDGRHATGAAGTHMAQSYSASRLRRGGSLRGGRGEDTAIDLPASRRKYVFQLGTSNARDLPREMFSAAVNIPQHTGRWPCTSSLRIFNLYESTSYPMNATLAVVCNIDNYVVVEKPFV